MTQENFNIICEKCKCSADKDEAYCGEDCTLCASCYQVMLDELDAEFGWMAPYAAKASQAERDGDYELARSITEGCGVKYTGY